jgi:hypothetical protein
VIALLVVTAAGLLSGAYALGREVGEVRASIHARRRAERIAAEHKDERLEYFRRGYERGWNNGHGWGWRALRQLIEEQGTHVCDGECDKHPGNDERGGPLVAAKPS